MATSLYSSSLRLALPTTGDLFGTWGTEINNSITSMVDQAVAGRAVVNMASDANYTLTALNGTSDEARCAVLRVVSGVSLTATRNVVCPVVPKLYIVENATTGGQAIQLIGATGTGVVIPNGRTYRVRCDGTNVVLADGDSINGLGGAAFPSYTFAGDTDTGAYSPGANEWAVTTGGVQRVHVNATGNLGFGTAAVAAQGVTAGKDVTGATTAYGTRATSTVLADVTIAANLYQSAPATQATGFVLTNLRHYHALPVTVGAGSTITNQYGFQANALTGATNNFGFRGLLAAAATSWNLYMDGDAKNYLAGRLLVGTTTENASGAKLQTLDGITFPATAVASTDANTLDDYEEGTFTPIVLGSSTAGTVGYLTQQGRYVKIGGLVYIDMTVYWTSHTGTGQLQVGGLPFAASSSVVASVLSGWNLGVTMSANTTFLPGGLSGGATVFGLRELALAGGGPAGIAVCAFGLVAISGTYRVD